MYLFHVYEISRKNWRDLTPFERRFWRRQGSWEQFAVFGKQLSMRYTQRFEPLVAWIQALRPVAETAAKINSLQWLSISLENKWYPTKRLITQAMPSPESFSHFSAAERDFVMNHVSADLDTLQKECLRAIERKQNELESEVRILKQERHPVFEEATRHLQEHTNDPFMITMHRETRAAWESIQNSLDDLRVDEPGDEEVMPVHWQAGMAFIENLAHEVTTTINARVIAAIDTASRLFRTTKTPVQQWEHVMRPRFYHDDSCEANYTRHPYNPITLANYDCDETTVAAGRICCTWHVCGVCIAPIKTEVPFRTTCGHLFHRECLRKWFAVNASRPCPMCRTVQPTVPSPPELNPPVSRKRTRPDGDDADEPPRFRPRLEQPTAHKPASGWQRRPSARR